MQHIEAHPAIPAWLSILAWIGVAVFVLISLYFTLKHARKHSDSDSLISYSFLVPFGACLVIALLGSMPNLRAQHAEFRQAVEDRYGIELSDAEFASLNYPRVEPTKDFEAFGSFGETTREDGKIISHSIHLIWEDGEFFLAESTSDQLTELETAR